MSKYNIYHNGAVHLDHSQTLEINQQNLNAADLERLVNAFMHGSPSHPEADTAQAAPMPVYAEEVRPEAEPRPDAADTPTLAQWLREAVNRLRQEGLLKHRYDFTWVMWALNHAAGRMMFSSSRSFLNYLTECGIDGLPSADSLQIQNKGFQLHTHPDNWTFMNVQDEQERKRRINVAKFTLHLLNDKKLKDKLL